jgi:hypothetical protein
MKRAIDLAAVPLALTQILGGCSRKGEDIIAPPSMNPAASTDAWLGQWTGPEGTFLRLEGANGTYTITIQDLDGPKTHRGIAAGDLIEFERNGVKEVLRPTNGIDTGMKWLSDKSVCLTVRPGEGFCRQ